MTCRRISWVAAVAVAAWALVACGEGSPPATAVTPLPTALAADVPARAELGMAVVFKTVIEAASSDVQTLWDFGDGSTSTEARPSHAYATPGRYVWRVTVRNGAGQQLEASGDLAVGRFQRLASSDCSAGAASGWCWQLPARVPSWLRSVDLSFDAIGLAVGGSGALQISRDGAREWEPVATPEALSLVRMVTPEIGWAINASGIRLLRTLDGGLSWQTRGQPLLDVATVLLPRSADTVLVSGSRGGELVSLVSRDGGQTFSPAALVAVRAGAGDALLGLAPGLASGLITAAGLAEPRVPTHASFDFGQTAVDLQACCSSSSWVAVDTPSAGTVEVLARQLGGGLELSRSADRGKTWTRSTASGLPDDSFFGTPDRLDWSWILTAGNALHSASYRLFHSTDRGRHWVDLGSTAGLGLAGLPLADLTPIDDRQLWVRDRAAAAGLQTKVFDRVSGQWRTLSFPGEEDAPQVLQRAGSSQWLAGFASPPGRRWYVSSDSGQTWRAMPGNRGPESDGRVLGIWFFDGRQGLLLRSDGAVQTTSDGGLHWLTAARLTLATHQAPQLHVAPDGVAWVADGKRLHRSMDRGSSWQVVSVALDFVERVHFSSATKGWLHGLACQKASDGSLFACTGQLHASEDGGQTFVFRASTDTFGQLYAGDRESLALRIQADRILRSGDGGNSWGEPISVSDFPLAPSFVLLREQGSSWIMNSSLCAGFCSQHQLLRSDDGGRTWREQVLPMPAPGPLAMAFADARTGWIVGAGGALLRTDDGGDTWQVQASGTLRNLSAVFALDASTVWVGGGHPATVLTTSTGGR